MHDTFEGVGAIPTQGLRGTTSRGADVSLTGEAGKTNDKVAKEFNLSRMAPSPRSSTLTPSVPGTGP